MNLPDALNLQLLLDPAVFGTGLVIFLARIIDVSIGTIRTIVTVHGRTVIAFCLAVVEVTVWITVISTVISQITEKPILVFFYSLGYATGNVVGILVERRLAFGVIVLKVFSATRGTEIAEAFRRAGLVVTTFLGEGMQGPVIEIFLACRRRDLRWMIPKIHEYDTDAFYVVEQARDVSKVLKPIYSPLGGWRQRHNRK